MGGRKSNPTPNSAVFCPVESGLVDIEGRVLFLYSLQTVRPGFWVSFNQMWRAGRRDLVEPWLKDHQITDQWLLEVLCETMLAWDGKPDGPGANLQPGYIWYSCGEEGDTPVVGNFRPILTQPYPMYDSDRVLSAEMLQDTCLEELQILCRSAEIETLEAFERRMLSQFRQQLKCYSKRVRSVMGYGKKAERVKHATWTARVFVGETRAVIAREQRRNRDAESAVARAVTRFAQAIRLTLPARKV